MSLAPGTRLGPYEITAHIGAGGMGEVYRAKDTKLNRDVAIKVLPESFALDTDRVARFSREAQVLASLNHPNIAAIYGIEEQGNTRALVMELVDGDDLSAHIARGAIPLAESLPIAKQIAEALEAAHEQGVIHRDLKPANIKVRADGTVKVLDFGLAKAMDPASASSAEAMNSPTLTARGTQMGMIIGTAAYMSPEQARGKAVDRRADIWAFGVVLYEMLSGTRAFDGDEITDVLAAVLRQDIDWTKLPSTTPPRLRGLLERALDRDPKQRLRDIGEARVALVKIIARAPEDTLAPATVAANVASASRRRERVAWFALGVGCLAGLTLAAFAWPGRTRAAEPQRAVHLQLILPEGFNSSVQFNGWAQISPDGRTVMMSARSGLSLRSLESGETRVIPGSQGAVYPFWSPDNKNVAFFQQGRLKRIAAEGGPVLDICPAVDSRGGTWSRDDIVLFAPGLSAGLFRVPAGGGAPEIVVKPTPGASAEYLRYPSFLPDGKHFLFQRSAPQESGFYVGSLDGTPARLLARYVSNAVYAPPANANETGRLLFLVNRTTLMSQPFDLATLQLTGEGSPVAEGVGTSGQLGNGSFSVSENGALVYAVAAGRTRQMTFVDRHGHVLSTVGSPMENPSAAISPDGMQVAYVPEGGDRSLFVQQVTGGPPTRIATNAAGLTWSHDGRIVFNRSARMSYQLFVKHLDGAAQEDPVGVSAQNATPWDWSRDGKWIVYSAADNKTGIDLWVLPLDDDRKPVVFLQTPATEMWARFSPVGRWMSFMQTESDRPEVFVQAISPAGAAAGRRYRISAAGGTQSRWGRDGTELVYVSYDEQMIAVPIVLGSTVQPGTPQTLFTLPPGASLADMTTDAQRFLISIPASGAAQTNTLTVVLNWQAAVKK